MPGHRVHGRYQPGHWRPTGPAPRANYVYVPGWWERDLYIDGYYRPERRSDGDWQWVDGYYQDEGSHISGHWAPAAAGPEGYSWEPGFWDGETYVEGFWRPDFRSGYTWLSAYYDDDGIYHSGYWTPYADQPGYVWIPGWFDGNEWVPGYWVDEGEYSQTDLSGWQPEAGWDEGWEVGSGWGDGEVIKNQSGPEEYSQDTGAYPEDVYQDAPLAIPVPMPD